MPHRGLRLWLRQDPALPRPTGERARAACRDKSNEDPALPRPTGERARAACRDHYKLGKASAPGFILEWVYS